MSANEASFTYLILRSQNFAQNMLRSIFLTIRKAVMAKNEKNLTSEEIFASPIPNIEQITIGINRIVGQQLNSYTLRNDIILNKQKAKIIQKNDRMLPATAVALQAQSNRNIVAKAQGQQDASVQEKKKRQVLYRKGFTILGASFAMLDAEAKLDIDHSAKLGRNISVANPGMQRPSETDAHHIVAREDWRADLSRIYIFKVGIGINDADNGGIMPRYFSTHILSMPNASKHQGIHTAKYHANVYTELLYAAEHTAQETRLALRSIKSQLLAGTFPF